MYLYVGRKKRQLFTFNYNWTMDSNPHCIILYSLVFFQHFTELNQFSIERINFEHFVVVVALFELYWLFISSLIFPSFAIIMREQLLYVNFEKEFQIDE